AGLSRLDDHVLARPQLPSERARPWRWWCCGFCYRAYVVLALERSDGSGCSRGKAAGRSCAAGRLDRSHLVPSGRLFTSTRSVLPPWRLVGAIARQLLVRV